MPRPALAGHVDVLIIGAGISGICAAYYVQTRCPGKSYAILEARDAIGGTWDLFKYPGIRSDSDLFTFGFSFNPWLGDKAIADGPSILAYVRETAARYGITPKINFGCRAKAANWDAASARWVVDIERDGACQRMTCGFLYVGAGYYDYESGYLPEWPGVARFSGQLVHPQSWPEDLNYAGKRVVVIGSGATAVTLVPELAKTAAHVTMLQRSPTYIVTLPARDKTADWLRRRLPARLAHLLARWKNVALSIFFFQLARRKPAAMIKRILDGARAQLPPDYDIATHFTPRYNPWDQRLCLVPDGDLFRAIRNGQASVETGTIETFTQTGLRLASGRELAADIIVTATGLKLKMLGGMKLSLGGVPVEPPNTWLYKGMMLSGVPNLAVAIGYTNASWTLKCELTARYVCRLLRAMDAKGAAWCRPRRDAHTGVAPMIDFTSGYIQRAADVLPKQGERKPWRLYQNYVLDVAAMRFGKIEDGTMEFGKVPARKSRRGRPGITSFHGAD
jgi:cation diffusion facilitator CzcD-associated flavoprotein CzcO